MEIVGGASSSFSSMFSLRQRRRDKHCFVQVIDSRPLYLDVTINNIKGIKAFRPIINSSGSSSCCSAGLESKCIYYVALWVENPARRGGGSTVLQEQKTKIVTTEPSDINVGWWEPKKIEFKLDPAVFELDKLKLEVIRIGFGDEVGTSEGKRIVGRASIQINKLVVVGKESTSYHVDLVRTRMKAGSTGGIECRQEGKIAMDMKLSREYRFKGVQTDSREYRFMMR